MLNGPQECSSSIQIDGLPFNRVNKAWSGTLAQREGNHELALVKLGSGWGCLEASRASRCQGGSRMKGVWRSEERSG